MPGALGAGASSAGDRLRDLVARRRFETMQEDAIAWQRQNDVAKLGIADRQVGADESRAQADLYAATHPKVAPPGVSVLHGLVDAHGTPVSRGVDEHTGAVLWEMPEKITPPPGSDTTEESFIGAYARGLNKTTADLTSAERLAARKNWLAQAPQQPQISVVQTPTGIASVDRRNLGAGAQPIKDASTGEAIGRPVPPTVTQGVAETEGAIRDLEQLRAAVEKHQAMGPVEAAKVVWPWSDENTFQALIAGVNQRIGKAMEGGVLRAEDVPKYAAILPQLRNPQGIALDKIDNVIDLLEGGLSITRQSLGKQGMSIPRALADRPDLGADGKYHLMIAGQDVAFDRPSQAVNAARRVRAAQAAKGGGR